MALRFSAALAVALVATACAQPSDEAPPPPASTVAPASVDSAPPALVVVLVVDQLSPLLLERWDDLFTGGFRRLLDHGRVYTLASHDHAATRTAVGHAALATGVHPDRHGIVANQWYERTPHGWTEVSSVADATVRIVGHRRRPGVSPHRLQRSGLAEWLREARPAAIVAAVSGKARGAVQLTARARGHVYWFDRSVGRFVTSTYYRSGYPAWVRDFHARVMPRHASGRIWQSVVPVGIRGRTAPDTAVHEGDGVHTAFPHRFAAEGEIGGFWEWFDGTPMLDAATLDFAETMVAHLGLGRDSVPDLLSLSLSSTDRVGHDYGPLSREQLDNLLRLDRRLAAFFRALDADVGAGRWAVVLSADHGVLVPPEERAITGARVVGRRMTAADAARLEALREDAERRVDDPAMPGRLAAALEALDFVAEAWTHEELLRATPRDSFALLARRSLYPGRRVGEFGRLGVEVRFVEGFLTRPRGSGHGTPYWYDRHVPLLFMGAGIPPGRDARPVSTLDVAPTLARLLGVAHPPDLDGEPLSHVEANRVHRPAMGGAATAPSPSSRAPGSRR